MTMVEILHAEYDGRKEKDEPWHDFKTIRYVSIICYNDRQKITS